MVISYLKVLVLGAVAAVAALATYWQVSLRVESHAFGQYSLFLSLVGLGAMVLVSWPDAALLRFGREEWNRTGKLGEVLAGRWTLYIATEVIAIAIAWWLDPLLRSILVVQESPFAWVVLALLLLPLPQFGIYAHLATGRTVAYGYVPVIGRLVLLAGIILLPLALFRPTWDYLAAWALAGVFASALVVFLRLPRAASRGLRSSFATLRKMLRYSWSIPLGAMAAYSVNWVDIWVIRAFMGPEDVGVYAWAYQIVAIGALAFAALGIVLNPIILDARLRGDTRYLGQFGGRCLRLSALAAVLGLLGLALVYPILCGPAGPGYQRGYAVLLFLVSALPLQLLSYLMTPVLMSYESLVPKVTLISLGMVAGKVAGDLLLIPLAGITGPSVVNLAAYGLGAAFQMGIVARTIPRFAFPPLEGLVACAVLMPVGSLALLWVGPGWGSALSVGLAVAALLVARRTAFFPPEDAEWLSRQPLPPSVKRALALAASQLATERRALGRGEVLEESGR